MAARASLLDSSKEFAPQGEQAPEALARVHFVRILDPDGQAVAVLIGNVHQYQARESMLQSLGLRNGLGRQVCPTSRQDHTLGQTAADGRC